MGQDVCPAPTSVVMHALCMQKQNAKRQPPTNKRTTREKQKMKQTNMWMKDKNKMNTNNNKNYYNKTKRQETEATSKPKHEGLGNKDGSFPILISRSPSAKTFCNFISLSPSHSWHRINADVALLLRRLSTAFLDQFGYKMLLISTQHCGCIGSAAFTSLN